MVMMLGNFGAVRKTALPPPPPRGKKASHQDGMNEPWANVKGAQDDMFGPRKSRTGDCVF